MKLRNRRLASYSIQKKLFFTLGLGAAGFVIYFVVNVSILNSNQRIMKAVVEEHLPILESADRLSRQLADMKNSVVQSALAGTMDAVSALDSHNKKVVDAFSDLKAKSGGRMPELDQRLSKYSEAFKGASDILQNVVAGIDQLSSAQLKIKKYNDELSDLETWAGELRQKENEDFHNSIASAITSGRRADWAGWILLFGLIPFAFFVYFLVRNAMEALSSVSSRLAEVSQNVLLVSNEAATSSSKLAASATQQSTSVTESVSSMDSMRTKLTQTVRHSAEALKSSEDSFRQANEGKVVIDSLRMATLEIERSYQQLEEVTQVVQTIGEKTAIINDIVFKTQLLSFNASIEAARAGQHGRGFAVVAAEVGKLAELSGRAAQEIGKLLDQSTKKVSEIVNSTKDKVGSANEMSRKCASVFELITERAGQVKTMVNSITDAAADQESGILQVGQAMSDMNTSANATDRMAHEMARLAEVLKDHSQTLAQSLGSLEDLVHGQGSGGEVRVLRPYTKEEKKRMSA